MARPHLPHGGDGKSPVTKPPLDTELREWKQKTAIKILSVLIFIMISTMFYMCIYQMCWASLNQKDFRETYFNLPDALIAITTATLGYLVTLTKFGEQNPPPNPHDTPDTTEPGDRPRDTARNDEAKLTSK